ncbi:rhodanese-like domain-containing protein [Fontisphaera persica]|uniref:rhodanese-like domain-containing protein n=1 Tax=Fontisphaera persica TaxID=2974023 RepID=UPI0024C04655|nr:rhodanese-like domain-containing protein [Fontisphaera persica]WCJ59355.1 rhodanese-like domain-containing protein [Fontisphaera persica]
MKLQMTPRELAERLRSAHPPKLLDVREPEEYAIVRLDGARLIPLGELLLRHEELADWREEEIVVYCHHGLRSLSAIGQLRHLGFEKLRNLAGGIDRWSVEVDPSAPRY